MDRRRILFIILFAIATIGIGLALYFVFFYATKPTIQPGTVPSEQVGKFPTASETQSEERESVPEGQGLPDIGTVPSAIPTGASLGVDETGQQIRRVNTVVDTDISNATVDARTNEPKFYNQQDGHFYKLDATGQPILLSEKIFFNVDTVTWSPTKNESIIEYPDGANIYYNFETEKQVTLPTHWDDFSFANTGDKIAAKSLGFSAENRWIISSDPDGNNISLIEPLGNNADKVIIDWSPSKQVVGLSLTGETLGADRQEVLFIGQNGENFKSTIVEGRDLRTKWSEGGTKLLYSVHNARNEFKPELWVVNGQGDEIGNGRKLLNVDTWADKCAFKDDRFVFCGVPQTLEVGSGFAPSLADATQDDLYKIDVDTGLKTKIPVNSFHVIKTINISKDGKTLYFTDKNIPGLFSVQL